MKESVLILFGADSNLMWGRSYQIAKAYASLGHAVSYIDLPGSLKQGFVKNGNSGRCDQFDISIFKPIFGLPCAKFPWLRRLNYIWIKAQLINYLRKNRFSPSIIWAYSPYEPKITRYLRDIYSPKFVVYDIADERIALTEAQFGEKAAKITKDYEEEIALYCDALITITNKLKNTKKHLHENIVVMPNGIDTMMFNSKAEYIKPKYFSDIQGKIVLYIGAVEEWVDIEAIRVAANDLPNANFVLVGPANSDITILNQNKNIHLIGRRPYVEMPAYIAHADVCILPFKDNEITRNSDPLKLLQYLSMGKPAVALFFEGVNDFGGAVSLASDYKEFSAMIRRAMDKTTQEAAFDIKDYDWKYLVSRTIQQFKNQSK